MKKQIIQFMRNSGEFSSCNTSCKAESTVHVYGSFFLGAFRQEPIHAITDCPNGQDDSRRVSRWVLRLIDAFAFSSAFGKRISGDVRSNFPHLTQKAFCFPKQSDTESILTVLWFHLFDVFHQKIEQVWQKMRNTNLLNIFLSNYCK